MVRPSTRPFDLGLTALALAVGLWCSRGVLDRVGTGAAGVRVALLPSVWSLVLVAAAVVAIFSLLAATLAWLSRPEGRDAVLDDLADWLKPLRASALLALPYLPWVPERAPLAYALAGPGAWYVWAVCGALVAFRFLASMRPSRLAAGVAAVTISIAVYATAAGRLGGTPLFPGGDEPHYLVITQSLLSDGDLRIENNHDRGDYRSYFAGDLEPHYRTRGTDREIYSIHPVGLPVLLMPVFAAGGYWAVVGFLVVCSAFVAFRFFRRALELVEHVGPAVFAWAAVFVSPAFVFNSFTVYPEMAAAVVTTAVFLHATREPRQGEAREPSWWLLGLGAGLLPWLSTKYAPLSAALVVVSLLRAWPSMGGTPDGAVWRRWFALGAPYALSLAAWFAFFYAIWGTPLPSAPYGADDQTSPGVLVRGGPGLWFDQEYGVVATAPALLLAFAGGWRMVREGARARRLAFESLFVLTALWATVGAFELWWGGTATVGRPVIAAIGLLAIPVAWEHLAARERPRLRALHYILLAIGLANVAVLLTAQEGLLLSANRSGRSTLLEWLSPSWPIVDVIPSFIAQSAAEAWATTTAWLAAVAAVGWFVSRRGSERFGSAGVVAAAASAVVVLLVGALVGLVVTPTSAVPLDARVRVPLLDHFDSDRLPLAVRFDPLHRLAASELLPEVSLTTHATDRRERPPIPLLYNARYSLPAGHYQVELLASRSAGSVTGERLALQLGRAGPITQEWEVTLSAPGVWGRTFDLPVDMGLVGFKATEGLTNAGFDLRLRPVSIVDAHRRVPVQQVLSVRRYGSVVTAFEHELAWPEPTGFWVAGGEPVRILVNPDAPAAGDPPTELVLRLHSGDIPNTVVLEARGKAERLELFPNRPRTIVLPLGTQGATTVTVAARDYFVPSERDPQSRDRRHLGCWIEIVGFELPQASAPFLPRDRS